MKGTSAHCYRGAPGEAVETTSRALRVAPSRILICRPNARLGNALLLTPLIEEIETILPGAEVDILTACPAAEEIFREFSCVRTVYRLPKLGARHPLRHLLTLMRASRTRYDLIVDPCPKSWSSRFATRLLYGKFKLGFSSRQKARGCSVSIPIEQAPTHMAAYPVHLIRQGICGNRPVTSPASVPRLTIRLTAQERGFGRRKLRQLVRTDDSRPVLAVATQATGAKELSPSWWRAMLCRVQAEMPCFQVVEILSENGLPRLPEYPGYFSTRIRRVAAVINAADCFVSADSGLMHLGAATNTAVVGLFKVTQPSVYGPYGGGNRAFRADEAALPALGAEIVQRLRQGLARKAPRIHPEAALTR